MKRLSQASIPLDYVLIGVLGKVPKSTLRLLPKDEVNFILIGPR